MKQILLILALVGCGKETVDYAEEEPEESPDAPWGAAETNAAAWVSDPNDPNNVKIEAAIRRQIGKPTGELAKADSEKVTILNLRRNQLTNVKDLEKLAMLEVLFLEYNQLTDVKGLEKLTKLKGVNLSNNPDLTKAQIAELQKALPNCEVISTPPNPLLTKEESAKAIEAAIREEINKPTGELTKADYERVEGLNLRSNKLTSVKGLEKLTKLTSLVLAGNQLTEMKALENLTQLEILNLANNPDLTKAQIAELKKVLPKCLILSNPKK